MSIVFARPTDPRNSSHVTSGILKEVKNRRDSLDEIVAPASTVGSAALSGLRMSSKKPSASSMQLDLLCQDFLPPRIAAAEPHTPTDSGDKADIHAERPDLIYLGENFAIEVSSGVVTASELGLATLSETVPLRTNHLQLVIPPMLFHGGSGTHRLINRHRLRTPTQLNPHQLIRVRFFKINDSCPRVEIEVIEYLLADHDSTLHYPARGRQTTPGVVSRRDQLIALADQPQSLSDAVRELLREIQKPLKADTLMRIQRKSKRLDAC